MNDDKNDLIAVEENREAPENRELQPQSVILPVMNDEQMQAILGNTPKWAIKVRQGPGGKIYKYVTHGYVTDTLNKIFGFDWDLVIEPISEGKMYDIQVEEIIDARTKQPTKNRRHVAVSGYLLVRIHDPNNPKTILATIKKSGFGSQEWLPTMEFGDALKGARSDLIKVCAYQLGIGLDLYWNEQAEVEEFRAKFEEMQAAVREEERINNLVKNGYPDSFASLISKAKATFDYDLLKISEVSGKPLTELGKLSRKQYIELWDLLLLKKSDSSQ